MSELQTLDAIVAATEESSEVAVLLDSTAPSGPARRVQRVRLADVQARAVRWLLPGLILSGHLNLIAGVGGLGKSTWLCGIAAKLSTRGLDVLLVSYEDTAEEVLRPRVQAAQGDLSRVHSLGVSLDEGGIVCLPSDLDELAQHIRETRARLVVIDPIVAAISADLDAHKDQHVRIILGALAKLAADTDCGIAMVGHLNKSPGSDAYVRVANSAAFWNAARSVVLVTADPDEPDEHRLVTQAKANYSRHAPIERHVIESVPIDALDPSSGEPIVTSRMRYVEVAEGVVRDDVLVSKPGRSAERSAFATEWLARNLGDDDWQDSAQVKVEAADAGISRRTIERVAKELGLEVERRGYPARTFWRLPQWRLNEVHSLARLEEPHNQAVSEPPTSQLRHQLPLDGATDVERARRFDEMYPRGAA